MAGQQELLDRLERIDATLAAIRDGQATIQERCLGCQRRLNEHGTTLYGNGTEGLKVKTADLKQEVETLKRVWTEATVTRRWVVVTAIAGVSALAGLASFVASILGPLVAKLL